VLFSSNISRKSDNVVLVIVVFIKFCPDVYTPILESIAASPFTNKELNNSFNFAPAFISP